MPNEVFWLHSQLFDNTKKFMDMGNEELSNYIYRNCSNAIHIRIKELQDWISRSCARGAQTPEIFLAPWDSLRSKKWAPDVIKELDRIINVFKETTDIVVAEEYKTYIDNFEKKHTVKTRFSEASIKKMCALKAAKNHFKEEHAEIFISYAMMPYFSSAENKVKLKQYLDWLGNSDNLLKVSNDENEKLRYFPNQIESLEDPVNQYIEYTGYGYNELAFYNMMKALFQQLSAISNQDENVQKEETDYEILKHARRTYWRYLSPNPEQLSVVQTLGISELELKILVDDASEDTLTAYWSYWNRFDRNKKPSWNDCISHNGFYVEMLYFLYSRLWHQDSEYLKAVAQDIRDKGYVQYHTFINEEANIAPTVFIKENCVIGIADVKDKVFLSNCNISDGVVIEEDVTIDVKKIRIDKNVHIKKGTILKGEISANIVDDPLIDKKAHIKKGAHIKREMPAHSVDGSSKKMPQKFSFFGFKRRK